MANSRFGCVENVNAEHSKSLFVFSRFFGINVKDGELQVIVNLCVGFLILRAGGPLVIKSSLGWPFSFCKKIEYNQSSPGLSSFFADYCFLTNERPSSLDSLFSQNYCCPN